MVPHALQMEALTALEETRREGFSAGLVVLATGLGKTWLSAFDSHRSEFRRVLFVAHREEILNQAIDNFRRVRPTKKTGSKPTPFVYCGQVDFISWEGDAPISIRWGLREPVPPTLKSVLGVP